MRSPGFLLFVLALSGPVQAESLTLIDANPAQIAETSNFQLGGAVARASLPPANLLAAPPQGTRLRISVPRLIRETSETIRRTAFGGVRIYFGEAWTEGEDVFQLGTALTRGQTTAGISVTYEDESQDLTSSELYLDYALTERFRVGISGILSNDVTEDASPVPQLGLNAELSSSTGTFLQGGIADSRDNTPVFGVAIGLRF